ncbi:calcitonin gene-related peptide type 1 receptor isoform X2 [Dunckerocampus dactyliophorus]|uniref:calcitonin gene-related peptide type 1 receptor isoform X2 n=1 Tax=Dunckerocampus dactyliophorus TaxID=161453 RepID=UPI002406FF58|nr:calcitonin gene-related peptide type 1 receptor isoform X2 [Dunckerocampus dactyliophorus]
MKLAVGSLWILCSLIKCSKASAGTEPLSEPLLKPGRSEGSREEAAKNSQYKCLNLSNKERPQNKSGTFCGQMWDGRLCWEETPAGTAVTQRCPNHNGFNPTGNVTKYCDQWAKWVPVGSTCEEASKDATKEVSSVFKGVRDKPSTDSGSNMEKKILHNKEKCLVKMKQDPPDNKTGLFCSHIWDGWLCWDVTPAQTYATQNCPDYFVDFQPSGKATKYCGEHGEWFRHPESDSFWTNYTLCTSNYENTSRKQKLLDSKYKCLLKTSQDPPFNGTGLYCTRNWDGWLCWDDTAAGTYATQNCPDYFSYADPTEKASRYCGEDGQWYRHPESNTTWTNFTLCAVNIQEKLEGASAQLSGDMQQDFANEATVSPMLSPEEQALMKKILPNQYKCIEKMKRDAPYIKSGLYCSRNWDGWLCWDDTPAGTYTSQNCPNYFIDFDTTEKAIKYCGDDGQWFRHPDTNRTWSNYTLCNENTKAKLKSAYILFYMAIVGHALSIASLLISLAIFFYFRSLSCQRITLHKNLFCSYVLNSALTIFYLVAVVNNLDVVSRSPVWCKVLHFFHMYMLGCNYFWMLCEGIYLHTLIVVAVFAEEQHLHWYYLLGWGFPLVPASIHAVARKTFFDDNCWMSVETHLLYAVHGPIMAALVVNVFFLLNIIRVLVTKLRDTHRAESNMYMKAVRATLILVPLLGIQFVIFPWRPENRLAGEVYEYIMHVLMHYQGLLVATIFCFFNGEVQAALKRQWMQYKMQWGQRRKDHCSMRSTSYTATSITEVPPFMYHRDSNSEHLNGRHTDDSELVALKSGEIP